MREPKGLANHQMGMTAKTNAPAVLLTVASLIAACGGPPAASPTAVIDDYADGSHLDAYSAIVDQVEFGTWPPAR
jgi:hypothetical protein